MLRALGLPARRLRRVLAWQGVVLTTAMVLVGLPLGLVGGSALWRSVAHGLGVRDGIVVMPVIFLLVPASVLVAIGASLYPSIRARRQNVVSLLRVE